MQGFALNSAGLVRTARKLAAGEVFVPASVMGARIDFARFGIQ